MSTYVLAEILGANESTMLKTVEATEAKYGLTLTAEDVHQLVLVKKDILVAEERIELDEKALPDLVERCAASSYVTQDNLVEVVSRMQEAFYRLRNEWGNLLTDDSLKTIMMIAFEKVCGGNVEAMETTFMTGLKEYLIKNPLLWHIGAGYVIKTKARPKELGGWYMEGPEPSLDDYIAFDLSELDEQTSIEFSEALFGDIVSVSDEEIRNTFYRTVEDDEIPLNEENLMESIHSGMPLDQLLPILKKVSRKYKGTDCSSIKNQEAKRLLSGIDYTILQGMQTEGIMDQGNTSAELLYEIGQKAIYGSYKKAIDMLKALQNNMFFFENPSLMEDMQAADSFLYHYDYKFMPHLGEVSLNYPLLVSHKCRTNIEKIQLFLMCIQCEQKFFHFFPRFHIDTMVKRSKEMLKDPYNNCLKVIFRTDFELDNSKRLYFDGNTCRMIEQNGAIVDKEILREMLMKLVEEYEIEENSALGIYMNLAIDDFVTEWTEK